MRAKIPLPPFTSRMGKGELAAALIYLPIHIFLLPLALGALLAAGKLDEINANFLCYAIGIAYMLVFQRRFLRRDFDPLCDKPLNCLSEIVTGYALMLLFNLAMSFALQALSPSENQNNAAIMEMAGQGYGKVAAMSIFLAPIVEELMFRGGVFGLLCRYSRFWAYAGSMLLFSLYHVWGYAISDPTYWLYMVQYLPVSFLLCRCYERTNTIWASIFLHMLINSIAIQALMALQEML